jgi:alkyl sulfatase BDS1-like metallo-beta-lactamase superfamily hydrolase
VYQITDAGLGVGLVVKALADWGARLLDTPGPEEIVRADWLALHLAVSAPAEAVAGVRETYQVHIDDEVLHIVLTGAGVQARSGPAPGAPDLVIRTGQAAFIELSLGRTGLADLVAARRAQVSGDAGSAARAALLFSCAHHPKSGTDPCAAQKEEQQA